MPARAGFTVVGDGKTRFIRELKRRNVLRGAALYVGAVWALAQGISQLSGPLHLASRVTVWFLIACAIGFPFWVAFAWFYEFTPRGFKREREVIGDARLHRSNARRLDFGIIGVLAVAVVLLASGYFVRRGAPTARPVATAPPPQGSAFAPPANSLVVLPFANLNGDSKQRYFSDGITEELTDALGQNPGLRVIAWDTASKLRDSALSAQEIGRTLDVANVLNGSLEREGDRVRITAELVDVRTGMQRWSQHYDDSFADIFKVQDEVSAAIAGALRVKFAQVNEVRGGTGNPEAHDLVLKGRALMDRFTAADLAAARRNFERAVALDPGYAEAHALLARALLDLSGRSDVPIASTLPTIRAEAERAVALDPRSTDAWVALGSAAAEGDPPDLAKARADYRRALALDPSNAAARIDLGTMLPLAGAVQQDASALQFDPDNEIALNNLAVNAQDLGDWSREITAAEALLRLDPTVVDSAFYLAFARWQQGQYDQVVTAFDHVHAGNPVDREQVDAGRLVYRSLRDPALRPAAVAAVRALARHASNQDVAGNLLQLYLALGETRDAVRLLEGSCPADPVACNDLAVNPMYAALRSDPAFAALARKYTTVAVRPGSDAPAAAVSARGVAGATGARTRASSHSPGR